jgi:hypothetical protein
MSVLGIVLFGLPATLGAVICVGNALTVLQTKRTGVYSSWVPLFGGCSLAAALWLNPFGWNPWLGLLPLFLDYGCLPGFMMLLFQRQKRGPDHPT